MRDLAAGLFLGLSVLCAGASAQGGPANAVLLVARPDLPDPRFRETVILATQAPDGSTVGVILNRPTSLSLSDIVTEDLADLAEGYEDPVYYGGPVLGRTLVALFEADEAPAAPAFHVLKDAYLSMHPALIESLLSQDEAGYRLYAGFSGWAPGQLRREVERGDWYIVPATPDLLFRDDTKQMWNELLEQARGRRVSADPLAILPS